MNSLEEQHEKLVTYGFAVIESVYNDKEIEELHHLIIKTDTAKPAFRKTNDLFAIRQFLKEIPTTIPVIFNNNLKKIIEKIAGNEFFIVKSIYFDKPENSNWFVAYHQDLTISVDKRINVNGYGPWTSKQNQFAVQPPLYLLEDNFTIRIHLDETTEANGALKIIPASHRKGIYRAETIDWSVEKEITCCVPKGGIMLMKPLLLHASGRTTNKLKRRVIHIEFSRKALPDGLNWAEQLYLY